MLLNNLPNNLLNNLNHNQLSNLNKKFKKMMMMKKKTMIPLVGELVKSHNNYWLIARKNIIKILKDMLKSY
mgnify:CR=1 FL=1